MIYAMWQVFKQKTGFLIVQVEKIEAWILEQAGVTFDAKAVPGALRVVAVG